MSMVVAVLSGKGGTGKTSVCAALATAVAKMGHRVLCMDLDVGLRNLDISLGMAAEPVLSFHDAMEGSISLSDAAPHPLIPNLYLLTAPVGKIPEELNQEAFAQLVQRARQEFSWVFLDAPAGVGAGFRMAAMNSGLQLLVAGPDPASLRDAARACELLELMGKQHPRLVVNRVATRLYASLELTVDDIMDTVGCGLMGLVPEDMAVPLAAARDKPLLLAAGKAPAALACQRIARRLLGHSVPLKLM